MLGQLCTVLTLPLLGIRRVSKPAATVAVLVLVGATVLSTHAGRLSLLSLWLLVGCLCGILQFLATSTAAAANNPRWAFSVRVAFGSLVGATVVLLLLLLGGSARYEVLSGMLALTFAALAGLGVLLYQTPTAPPPRQSSAPRPERFALSPSFWAGFAVLFLFFVGQHGLWAFAVAGAQQRGLVVEQVLWAVALCKLAGGAFALASGWGWGGNTQSPKILLPALGVAVGGACLATTAQAVVFWMGLLAWEVGFNLFSARFQALLAQQDARNAGMWMTSAIFLGAASGPALAGWAIGAGVPHLFATFGVGTALVPWLWSLCFQRGHRGGAQPSRV